MADPVTPIPTPNPAAKPGASTSEYALTKLIVLTATAVGILGAALDTANTFAGWIPKDSWGFKLLAVGGGVVAFLKATVYTLSRAKVKIAAMETGTVPDLTPEQAAEILDGKDVPGSKASPASKVIAVLLALALPVTSLAEAPVYQGAVAAPAGSAPLVWKDPDGALHVGAWRSSDAEVKLAQRLVLAETQRDACQATLGDAQAKKALDCGEQAAATNHLWLWVTGGIVLGALGGYFTAQAVK